VYAVRRDHRAGGTQSPVHITTTSLEPPKGFDPIYRDTREPLPDRLKPLLAECWPCYEMIRSHALRPLPDAALIPRGVTRVSSSGAEAAADAAAAAAAVAAARDAAATRGGGGGVAGGTHAHAADARNAEVLVGVRDGVMDTFDLMWRPQVTLWGGVVNGGSGRLWGGLC